MPKHISLCISSMEFTVRQLCLSKAVADFETSATAFIIFRIKSAFFSMCYVRLLPSFLPSPHYY